MDNSVFTVTSVTHQLLYEKPVCQCACISTPVCSSKGDSAAPGRRAPSTSGSVLLASVQVAHLHELLLADIIHHILHTHTQKIKRKRGRG